MKNVIYAASAVLPPENWRYFYDVKVHPEPSLSTFTGQKKSIVERRKQLLMSGFASDQLYLVLAEARRRQVKIKQNYKI